MTLYRCYKKKKDLDKDVEQRGREEFDKIRKMVTIMQKIREIIRREKVEENEK